MNNVIKHSQIISLWPSVGQFAQDIKQKESTCRGWKLRNSIPAKYWQEIVKAASNRGFENIVTFETLVKSAV